MTEPTDPVLVAVTRSAPADAVWRAVRDPATIRRWFGWEYEGLDDEIRQIFVDEVAEASEADRHPRVAGDARFTVEERDGGSLLRVTRPAPAGSTTWDEVYDDMSEGWITFVHQLRFLLERHPDDDRRTVFLSGQAAPGVTDPVEVLGLGAVAGHPAGTRYTAPTATGEELAGEVWFRSPFQLGLTVDGWSDGLLVLGTVPAGPDRPAGAMAVLTTYRLDDEAFAAVERRWTGWWGERYPAVDAPGAD
jgi:uncharacterized protein YndB with AHSA1/START domain